MVSTPAKAAPKSSPSKIIVFASEKNYFDNIDAVEGSNIKLDARGTSDLLTSWTAGDLALVFIDEARAPSVSFFITDIQPRPDLMGKIEAFESDSERPHRVRLDTGGLIRMDLRRAAYKVLYRNTGKPVASKKLDAPIDDKNPIDVRICWQIYKFTVSGERVHHLTDLSKFPVKIQIPDAGFDVVRGKQCSNILKALNIDSTNVNEKTPSKLVHLTPESDTIENAPAEKRKRTPAKEKTPTKTPRKEKETPSTPSTPRTRSLRNKEKTSDSGRPVRTPSKKERPQKETLAAGTIVALRADDEKNFVLARVHRTTEVSLDSPNASKTDIPIRWMVEAHELALRGCYAAPNWIASVAYGAILKSNVKVRHDKEKDMYWLDEDDAALKKLV